MSEATLLDSVTFDEWIKSHDGIVLFHKKLCPNCKVMRTVLGKATAERPDIQLASVDSEEQPDLMARCSVERVPTLIVCRNGAVAARKSGIMNPRELLDPYRGKRALIQEHPRHGSHDRLPGACGVPRRRY